MALTSQLILNFRNKDIIATVEDSVKDLEKEEANTIRAKINL